MTALYREVDRIRIILSGAPIAEASYRRKLHKFQAE